MHVEQPMLYSHDMQVLLEIGLDYYMREILTAGRGTAGIAAGNACGKAAAPDRSGSHQRFECMLSTALTRLGTTGGKEDNGLPRATSEGATRKA